MSNKKLNFFYRTKGLKLHAVFLTFQPFTKSNLQTLLLPPGKEKSIKTIQMIFNPEFASEMCWEECVACVLTEVYSATCVTCSATTVFQTSDQSSAVAQFVERLWKYRRTKDGYEAVCPNCSNKRKPKKK